jgi:hypothetical protein
MSFRVVELERRRRPQRRRWVPTPVVAAAPDPLLFRRRTDGLPDELESSPAGDPGRRRRAAAVLFPVVVAAANPLLLRRRPRPADDSDAPGLSPPGDPRRRQAVGVLFPVVATPAAVSAVGVRDRIPRRSTLAMQRRANNALAEQPIYAVPTASLVLTVDPQTRSITGTVLEAGLTHNALGSTQGGSAGELYHLTAAEYAALAALIAAGPTPTPGIYTAADGATVTFDRDNSDIQEVTLGGNRTLATAHMTRGKRLTVRLIQDGTGSRTVTWWSGIRWPGAVTPTLTTTAGQVDVFGFICTGTGSFDGFTVGKNL